MRRVGSLVAITLAVCVAPISVLADESHAKRGHHVITVDSIAVHPQKLEITADQVVVWANYSGRTIHVKFPAEVAGAFTCAVRPSFYRSATGILSRPINSLEFALPCSLKPGEYEYRILGLSSGDSILDPEQESPGDPKGKIVVR
jgi:hypothetical protein